VKPNGKFVLVVDDERMIRTLVAKVLAARGFKPLEARNGLEAVQLYGSYRPDVALVVTDINMPVMNGLEAIDRIRELSPGMPIVVMTGGVSQVTHPRCCLLPKPFTPAQLLSRVEEALAA
jgi:CheY-like chemotaxis protein